MVKIGEKLKSLRNEKKMTQKDLAEQLNVSAQAVSRWENDDVEPSLETLGQLATIFNVSVDELFGKEPPEKRQAAQEAVAPAAAPEQTAAAVRAEVQKVMTEQRPVLAVCEDCNKPLYDGKDIVRERHSEGGSTVRCVRCNAKRQMRQHKFSLDELQEERRRAWIWSTVAAIALFIISLFVALGPGEKHPLYILVGFGCALALFAFLSCCFLDNTFVGEMWCSIAHWGFVDMPGVIFELDFDGIVFLIAVKILFAILGFLLAVASVLFATAVGLVVGIFAFPFALVISNREVAEEKQAIDKWKAIAGK